MIKVCIADDHEIVREGLKRVLADTKDIKVVSEAASMEEAYNSLAREAVDVIILDVNMPGFEGTKSVSNLLARKPGTKIIIFTMYGEDSHAVSFLRAGAYSFINKKLPMQELINAIRKVSSGKRYITPTVAEYLFEYGIDIEKKPHESLSEREYQVFLRLAQQANPTKIAEEMSLSVSTVNTYVQRIKLKLGVRTILQIVDYARSNGIS